MPVGTNVMSAGGHRWLRLPEGRLGTHRRVLCMRTCWQCCGWRRGRRVTNVVSYIL